MRIATYDPPKRLVMTHEQTPPDHVGGFSLPGVTGLVLYRMTLECGNEGPDIAQIYLVAIRKDGQESLVPRIDVIGQGLVALLRDLSPRPPNEPFSEVLETAAADVVWSMGIMQDMPGAPAREASDG